MNTVRLCEKITAKRSWSRLEQAAIGIVTSGGVSAMRYYRDAAAWMESTLEKDPAVTELVSAYAAENKNPPTRADLEATATILCSAESLLRPIVRHLICGLSYLGEETVRQPYKDWLHRELGDIADSVHIATDFFESQSNTLRVILDAIDGTANMVRGLPFFCTAAAILVDDQARISAVYDPIHGIVYSAVLPGPYENPELGATATAWEISVGKPVDLVALAKSQEVLPLRKEAIGIHLTRASKTHMSEFLSIVELLAQRSSAIYALNAGIPAMVYIAKGGFGAFLNNYTNPWDVAAGEVIVRACGGVVKTFDGKDVLYNSEKRLAIIASKAHLYEQLQEIVDTLKTP